VNVGFGEHSGGRSSAYSFVSVSGNKADAVLSEGASATVWGNSVSLVQCFGSFTILGAVMLKFDMRTGLRSVALLCHIFQRFDICTKR